MASEETWKPEVSAPFDTVSHCVRDLLRMRVDRSRPQASILSRGWRRRSQHRTEGCAETSILSRGWRRRSQHRTEGWVSFTSPVEQYDIEMPESYLLAFNEDGTVNIVADCNNALGSYTDDDGALTTEVGPMTMAACPEGSRSDQFVQYLGFAARYFFQDGRLYIDLFADGGTMVFAPASAEAMADGGAGAMATSW